MFGTFTNPKYGHTKVSQLVSDGIIKVSKKYSPKDFIQYIDISSIEKSSKSIASTTKYRVDEAPSRAQQCVQYGDIILSNVRPNLKTIAIVNSSEDNLVCSSGFTVLRCKESEPEYLVVAILDDYYTDKLMKKANGSNYPAVTSKDVLDGWIPFAPIELQHFFSSFVKQVNKSKSICKQIFQSLDNLVKSRFIEMFENNVDSKNWSIHTMAQVCEVVTDGSHFSPEDVKEGYPMLSVKDMGAYGFDYSNCKHISQTDYDFLVKNGCKPLSGDVLIAKDGSFFKKGFVIKEEMDQAILSSIAIMRPKKNLMNPNYLVKFLLSDKVLATVSSMTSGTALKRVILISREFL